MALGLSHYSIAGWLHGYPSLVSRDLSRTSSLLVFTMALYSLSIEDSTMVSRFLRTMTQGCIP
ncbi:unnamed protein product, partial [Dovyalis caffra]